MDLDPAVSAQATICPGLVSAWRFRSDGAAEALSPEAPIDLAPPDGWLWLHVNLSNARAQEWLKGFEALPEEAREALLEADDDQALHRAEACLYGVVVDLIQEFKGLSDQIGYLRFALTPRLLLTARRASLQAPDDLRRDLRAGLEIERPGALLEALVERIADGFDRLADRIGRSLDRIEDRVLANNLKGETRDLGRIRLTIVRVHRQVAGLRTLFHRLERSGGVYGAPALRLAAGDLAQRLDVLDHEIVALQARARLIQEETTAKVAADTNRNLYILSLITALLLPPSLVAGIFGMNVKGLPLTETDAGFSVAILLVALSAAVVFWVLKRRMT